MIHFELQVSQSADMFVAGGICKKILEWKKLTSDKEILSNVEGLRINFENLPRSNKQPLQYSFLGDERNKVNVEVQKLLEQKVIKLSQHERGQVTSPIFIREKADGTSRLILNLKELNKDVEKLHFKMDTLSTIINLVDPGSFMTKIDIKSAYYSVRIHENFQKYLKFVYDGQLYQYTCLPNGLTSGPRVFTKMMKPVLAHLRTFKIILAIYIDDLINLHRSRNKCAVNTDVIVNMLRSLGFTINVEKSVTTPSQIMEFLGFIINSVKMTMELTLSKKKAIRELALSILKLKKVQIRKVAKLIGKFTSSFIGVKYGPLHYRYLEQDKTIAVQKHKGNYSKTMVLSNKSKEDIKWWIDNIMGSYNHIGIGNPKSTITLTTDASKLGWGGVTDSEETTQGLWKSSEITGTININVLELKAVLFSLKSIVDTQDGHIRIRSDNTTTVHTINNMGTCRSLDCHVVVLDIWEWARENNNWLTATHIPGIDNDEADELSRKINTSHEWQLNPVIFEQILHHFQIQPELDLFASRVNTQMDKFVSYRPDPDACHIDAFTMDWSNITIYAFPPFACLGKVIRKIITENSRGILITPDWRTQYWFPMMDYIKCDEPFVIPPSRSQLQLPNDIESCHPLSSKLQLLAWKVSGGQ